MTNGLKTCSLPLFHSEFLHFDLGVINFIFPKNISDISQKRPIRLLTLNHFPFNTEVITISTVSESTRIGLFVMTPNAQHLESMFASFQRVACLFTIYSSGICICTNGRRTHQSHIGCRTTRLERLCSGALSLYDGGDEIMVMIYDPEQPRVHISAGISLTPAARLSHTARSNSTNMSNDPPNLAYIL